MRRSLLIPGLLLTLGLCLGQRCDVTPLLDLVETGPSEFIDDFDFANEFDLRQDLSHTGPVRS